MKVRDLVLVALFAALSAVAAVFLRIPAPIVPFTMQFLVVVLAGLLLGSKRGALSQAVYLALGLAGLPVFAGGGGPGYVLQPTFGYLLGFIPGAFLCGVVVERWGRLTFMKAMAAALICMVAVYACGVPYLWAIQNVYLKKAVTAGNVLYVGFVQSAGYDIVKCAVAALVALKLRPALNRGRSV